MGERVVILNALPLNAFENKKFILAVEKLTASEVYERHKGRPVMCFIRHPSTVELVNKILGVNFKPSKQLYHHREGDIMLVVTLKRPARGEERKELDIEDIEFWEVRML